MEHTLEMYEMRLKHMEEKLNDKESEIALLREQLEKRMDDITDIARQAKSKTTTTNNISIQSTAVLDLRDTRTIQDVLERHLDGNVLSQGQKGLARMLCNHFLTDEQGNKKYKCTDRSRHQFEYVAPSGAVEKDPRGSKLRDALVESKIEDLAMANGEELWTGQDGTIDHQRMDVFMDKVLEVANLRSDDTKFRSELSTLMS